jgi:hypothetical protein
MEGVPRGPTQHGYVVSIKYQEPPPRVRGEAVVARRIFTPHLQLCVQDLQRGILSGSSTTFILQCSWDSSSTLNDNHDTERSIRRISANSHAAKTLLLFGSDFSKQMSMHLCLALCCRMFEGKFQTNVAKRNVGVHSFLLRSTSQFRSCLGFCVRFARVLCAFLRYRLIFVRRQWRI